VLHNVIELSGDTEWDEHDSDSDNDSESDDEGVKHFSSVCDGFLLLRRG